MATAQVPQDEVRAELTVVDKSKPVFDFSEVGYGWFRQYRKVSMRLVLLQPLVGGQPDEGLSEDEKRTFLKNMVEAATEFDEKVEERYVMLAQVLKSVPRSWLRKNAPAKIDWSDTKSFDYLADEARFNDLMKAIHQGQDVSEKGN